MDRYNHMYTIAFTVPGSKHPYGDDVTAEAFRHALFRRIEDLDSSGELAWREAVGDPDDTYKE